MLPNCYDFFEKLSVTIRGHRLDMYTQDVNSTFLFDKKSIIPKMNVYCMCIKLQYKKVSASLWFEIN